MKFKKILPFFLLACMLILSACGKNGEASTTTTTIPATTTTTQVSYKGTVFIDPGHGFQDVGTESEYLNGLTEKDINLAVSLFLRDRLEAEGYKVVMSRENDDTTGMTPAKNGLYLMGLDARIDMANASDADVFICIHSNSFPADESVYGTRVYYYEDNCESIDQYAAAVGSNIEATVGGKTPLLVGYDLETAYAVTRRVNAPSLLVEMGFVTNPDDAARMIDPEWQQEMANGMAEGIVEYLGGHGSEAGN